MADGGSVFDVALAAVPARLNQVSEASPRDVEVTLNKHQREVMNEDSAREIYLITGVGGGKSFIGGLWSVESAVNQPLGVWGLAVAPVYHMIESTLVPAIRDAAMLLGLKFKAHLGGSNKHVRVGRHRIYLRSADDPQKILSLTVGTAWIDEAASVKRLAYENVKQRQRDKRAESIALLVTTTPEGTKTWQAKRCRDAASGKAKNVRVVRGSTIGNAMNLKEGFVDEMRELYADNPAGWKNYIEGLETDQVGNIYTALSQANIKPATDKDVHDGQVFLGWDFNVHCMVTVLGTYNERTGAAHIWGEVVSPAGQETQTDVHADRVREAMQRRHKIMFKPRDYWTDGMKRDVAAFVDATGSSASAVSSNSNHIHVVNAGFRLATGNKNPLVRDRIAAVQLALSRKRLFICPVGAPLTLQALKEHSRDKRGEPEKWHGPQRPGELQCDHFSDCVGYAVWGLMPVDIDRGDHRKDH